ncbi:hypothetical protein HPB52_019804 [Rhipicephalus sanguineus]|uniref:Transmembrane protein n=1 Tax=Rhipicephalus sanguineus TaxID=34632 RepID=A0A9D4T1G4_RHISA|nr:hypothetical protein HPB52_019804 [Rhipicephalus sanguineus]
MAIFVRPSRQALPTGMDGSTNGPVSESEQEMSRWLAAVAIAFLVFVIVLAVALVLQFYYPGIVPNFGRRRRLPESAEGNASRVAVPGPMPRTFLTPCGAAGCDRYPRLFVSQLNRSVDPCQDLRAFSCAARPRWRHSLRDEVVENASRAAMVNVTLSGSSGSAVAKTSTFYRTCVASKTPLDLQSLRAFLATTAADNESTMPGRSKAFQLAHVPAMSEVFFNNLLAAQESSWNRKMDKPSLPVPLRPRPHYDELRNEITLPIDFLTPPWFSPDSPPPVRLATIGLSLSLVLWRAIGAQRMYDVGVSSRQFLVEQLDSNHTCLMDAAVRGTDDATFLPMNRKLEATFL